MIEPEKFDLVADAELRHLYDVLGEFDPDEVDAELSMGVLKLTLDGGVIVVNSHRAAGQIWMAAFSRAWHFTPESEGGAWRWRAGDDELRATLARLLSERLGREVDL